MQHNKNIIEYASSINCKSKRGRLKGLVVQARIVDYINNQKDQGLGIVKFKIAQKAGLSRNRFSKIVNNHTEMSADEFEKICKALNVSPSRFIEDPTKIE